MRMEGIRWDKGPRCYALALLEAFCLLDFTLCPLTHTPLHTPALQVERLQLKGAADDSNRKVSGLQQQLDGARVAAEQDRRILEVGAHLLGVFDRINALL